MDLWPIQQNGLRLTLEAIAEGYRRIALTSPTGTGKSRLMLALAEAYLDRGQRVLIYTSRRSLFAQWSRVLDAAGVDHGRRAAGYLEESMPLALVSMPTEGSRVVRRKKEELIAADLVMVDEGHLHTGAESRKVMDLHHAAGAVIVLVTATPLGMAGVADKLVTAGSVADGRACGALVPALHYGPDEPDMRAHKALRVGSLPTEPENRKIMRPQILFGRVLEWFNILNPERKPSILFASGVEESLWFAQELTRIGVPSAHIDGDCVWVGGEFHRSNNRERKRVLDGSRAGGIACICNRYVLREGIDAPWLQHGILATVFGGVQSYLQSGGRLLRAHPGVSAVTVQDHGGNWWRHGSLNAERLWRLEYTADMMDGIRHDRLRENQDPRPGVCPQCKAILYRPRCRCGWEAKVWRRSRAVMQTDGTLREMTGDIWHKRSVSQRPEGPAVWERMYFRSRTEKGARTFRAAMALFAQENNWQWPDKAWPYMPREELDFYRLVADVPHDRLIPKGAQ